MSIYRTHFYIKVDTVSHADTIRNAILSELGSNSSFDKVEATSDLDDEIPRVNGDFYYATTSSRDIVNNWINSKRNTNPTKNWIKTGWVCWHKWDSGLNMDDPACEFGEIYI